MTINLRKRKQTKNGKISLCLEIYKGKSTTLEGKTRYIREYEYLDLFLVDAPRTEADKRHNKEVLQLTRGTPIFTVQKLLGHTNINSTIIFISTPIPIPIACLWFYCNFYITTANFQFLFFRLQSKA